MWSMSTNLTTSSGPLKNTVTLSLFCLGQNALPHPHLTPHDPCHTRSWHILPCSFPSPQRGKFCGVCVNAELNTEGPPDNLEEPVPIYTASRWCLSIVWQKGVLSNCVKPHIVMLDKESLLSSWYKVQVKQTKDMLHVKMKPVGISYVYFRNTVLPH